MHFSLTLTQLAYVGIASAGVINPNYFSDEPSGHDVSITGVAFAGSGCPAGSVAGQLATDLTTLTLLYDSFVSQAGPGIQASEYRKNCQLNVKLEYPQGWQFSVFKADYRGYAQVPEGDTGTVKSTYYFSGDSKQVSYSSTSLYEVEQCDIIGTNTLTSKWEGVYDNNNQGAL
jgi:hypothetical protein